MLQTQKKKIKMNEKREAVDVRGNAESRTTHHKINTQIKKYISCP